MLATYLAQITITNGRKKKPYMDKYNKITKE
jgi:hypothetical protein